MAIGSVSEGSSNAGFNAEEEPALGQTQPHTAEPSLGSANPENQTAGSRAASLESLTESFGSSGNSSPTRSDFDPGTIRQHPISQALRGVPIENPEKLNVGTALHPNLQESPNIEPEGQPTGQSKGPIGKAAGTVFTLASKAGKSVSQKLGGSAKAQQETTSSVQRDVRTRQQAANQRDRELDNIQDNPEDRKTRRKVRGSDREPEQPTRKSTA
jgi:hypothetical protein